VWMVHLGGHFSLGYDDATLEAIQASGGGAADSVDEALTRLAAALAGAGAGAIGDVVDGYTWSVVPTEVAQAETGDAAPSGDGFAPLAARRLILAETQSQRGALGQVETLDQLHAIAVDQGIVTPYSSMIVLVNERQERLLNRLEAGEDRFEREYEEIGETVPESALTVTGVPEPEEWLLIAVAVGMLVWYMWKGRQQLLPRRIRAG